MVYFVSALVVYFYSALDKMIDGDRDIADALLTGDMLVQTPDSRHYKMQGAMRLVRGDGTVLWSDTVYNSPLARSATSSFADNVAKRLVTAISDHHVK